MSRWFPVWRDVVGGLDRLIAPNAGAPWRLARIAAGLLVGWWLYVPIHELLHAAACVASGGEVSRLEIAPEYGGAILGAVFPFVVAGGEYAGRLSGFDTHGSDLRYVATDLGPFVLTLFPGVWLLRKAARRRWPLVWGLALPLALAPFLSLTGDAYEIGSILTTNLPPWSAPPELRSLLRGDDGFLVARHGWGESGFASGFVIAAVAGLLWSVGTYALAAWIAARLREPA